MKSYQRGLSLIGLIIIIVVIIAILTYFGVNLRGIFDPETGQDNFHYLRGVVISLWNTYLSDQVSYFWNEVAKPSWAAVLDRLTP